MTSFSSVNLWQIISDKIFRVINSVCLWIRMIWKMEINLKSMSIMEIFPKLSSLVTQSILTMGSFLWRFWRLMSKFFLKNCFGCKLGVNSGHMSIARLKTAEFWEAERESICPVLKSIFLPFLRRIKVIFYLELNKMLTWYSHHSFERNKILKRFENVSVKVSLIFF